MSRARKDKKQAKAIISASKRPDEAQETYRTLVRDSGGRGLVRHAEAAVALTESS